MQQRALARAASVVAAVLAVTLTPTAVLAEETSQGRTYGGTAHGVKGEVEVRRPGLSSGNNYFGIVGGKTFGNKYYVVGYRTDRYGNVTRIAEYDDDWDNTHYVITKGDISTPSGQRIIPRMISTGVSIEFSDNFGYIGSHGRRYDENEIMNTVFVRLRSTQAGTYLSQSGHYFFQYQATASCTYCVEPIDFRPWGEPTAVYLTPGVGACGRFSGTTSYFSAFDAPC